MSGDAYLEVWGPAGARLVPLSSDRTTIGRAPSNDVAIDADATVSKLHAVLVRYGDEYAVRDVGSSNGTFLNGERVHGHRVLNDRDQLRFGNTEMSFRDTTQKRSRTVVVGRELDSAAVSPAQRKVLVALCRPYKHHSPFARPASNRDIAAELVLSVESVKSHLRALFAKFDLDDLPQNEKRVRLVEHAFQHGLVRDSEL